MTTNTATTRTQPAATSAATQTVMIVNGNTNAIDLLEQVLDAGHYDVVFVESSAHAYSQIKRVRPHLVILCVRIDDPDGFQVLSMLKLDEETRHIPVLTCTSEYDAENEDADMPDATDADLFVPCAAVRMN
jgi:twitching motility two-component system response regulator PilH